MLSSSSVGVSESPLTDVSEERLPGHWAVEHHWSGQTIAPQHGDEGGNHPVAEQHSVAVLGQ
jgi:hypothetical protein